MCLDTQKTAEAKRHINLGFYFQKTGYPVHKRLNSVRVEPERLDAHEEMSLMSPEFLRIHQILRPGRHSERLCDTPSCSELLPGRRIWCIWDNFRKV